MQCELDKNKKIVHNVINRWFKRKVEKGSTFQHLCKFGVQFEEIGSLGLKWLQLSKFRVKLTACAHLNYFYVTAA